MAGSSKLLLFVALATTAGCSLVFGFDELLPLPPAAADAGDARADADASDAAADAACPQGFDDCDDKPGCETVVSGDDSKNCGACGRTCGGGQCKSGSCSPEVIATDDALTVAADSTGVYWSTVAVDAGADAEPVGEIVRSAPDGGSRTVVANATSQTGTGAIALDGTHVYWGTSTDKLRRAPKSGGTVESFDLASTNGSLVRIAVGADTAYTTVRFGSNLGRVDAVPLSGGASITTTSNQDQPYGIALGPQHVFWVSQGTSKVTQTLLDGGSPVSIPSYGDAPQYIATDGDRLYWTHAKTGAGLWAAKLPLSPGVAVEKLFSGDGMVGRGIAVDATHVYWSSETGIDRIRKDGTKHVALVRLPEGVTREIAIDDAWVYFVILTPTPVRVARTPK